VLIIIILNDMKSKENQNSGLNEIAKWILLISAITLVGNLIYVALSIGFTSSDALFESEDMSIFRSAFWFTIISGIVYLITKRK